MAHTPGVWQIAQPKGAGTARMIWRNDEGPNSSAETNTNHRIIARDVHNEGDARLIAAAPDMLAELKGVVGGWYEGRPFTTADASRIAELIKRAGGQ